MTWEGLLRCDTLLGVGAGMLEIRRLTGVGRPDGLRSLLPIAEGVRRPNGGPSRSGILQRRVSKLRQSFKINEKLCEHITILPLHTACSQ